MISTTSKVPVLLVVGLDILDDSQNIAFLNVMAFDS